METVVIISEWIRVDIDRQRIDLRVFVPGTDAAQLFDIICHQDLSAACAEGSRRDLQELFWLIGRWLDRRRCRDHQEEQEQSGGDEPSAKKAQMPVRPEPHGAEMVSFMKQVIVEQADGIAKVFFFHGAYPSCLKYPRSRSLIRCSMLLVLDSLMACRLAMSLIGSM